MTEPESTPEFRRLPGLFRSWELPQVVEPRGDYRVEDAGETEDGAPLFVVWQRDPAIKDEGEEEE
jgi:hypothetical protein